MHAYVSDALENALRDGMRGDGIGAAQNDHELFAAVAADDVGLPQFRYEWGR